MMSYSNSLCSGGSSGYALERVSARKSSFPSCRQTVGHTAEAEEAFSVSVLGQHEVASS